MGKYEETKKNYVISIDAGTTGVRCLIVDLKGNTKGLAYRENPLEFPSAGLCECDGEAIEENIIYTTSRAMKESGIDPNEIGGISFTFMRSSFFLRKNDGSFARKCIMWQDLRAAERFPWMREQLAKAGMTPEDYYAKTAFPLEGSVLPNNKIYWVKEHEPEVFEDTDVIHSVHALCAHVFGVEGYIDDKEDIGWFGIHDADTMEYAPEIAEIFGVSVDKYSKMEPSGTIIGYVTKEAADKMGLVEGIPIVAGLGDHQAAAIGLGNNHEGLASLVLGTAGVLVGHSSKPVRDPKCSAWVVGTPLDGEYELECHSNAAASSYRWLRDAIMNEAVALTNSTNEKIDVYEIMNSFAEQAEPGCNGLIYLPWNAGAACPHYNPTARGGFVGFTFAHGRPEITRSVMEGVAFDVRDMWELEISAGLPEFDVLRLSGGAARSPLWCQIMADVLNTVIETTENEEATALGAAMLAAVGSGLYPNLQQAIDNMVHVTGRYEPIPENVEKYNELYKIFGDTYEALSEKTFPGIAKFQGF